MDLSGVELKAEQGPNRGSLGKAATLTALGVAALTLSGCAMTMGTYGPYGYGHSTVGIAPDGTVYTQEVQHGPYGTHVESESVGPWGWQRTETQRGPFGSHQRHQRVGPHGNYEYHEGHQQSYPVHPWLSPW